MSVYVYPWACAQSSPGISKNRPEATQINSSRQISEKGFQRHIRWETSNWRGEPPCLAWDTSKLILTSWGDNRPARSIRRIRSFLPVEWHGKRYLVKCTTHLAGVEKNGVVCEDQKVIPCRTRWHLCMKGVVNAHLSPASSRAFLCNVIPKSWWEIWAESGPSENQPYHTHKHELSVLCQSVSFSFAPTLSLSFTHAHMHTYTHFHSAKSPMGESIWLLEMSNYFVTSNLSQGS